ncbi:IS110 family transposase, partial [Bacillus sp. AFS002410]|uniref:IS110 family transposase n=1 Tax=Bacillus sp. AFS002410 TaxID=2033481 RepID=UPI000BFAE841
MNPVVGLDVAKGESQIQAFLDRKTPFKKSFKISHTVEGFKQLHQFLLRIEEKANTKPVLIMESTGHYHSPVMQFLDSLNYIYIVINPL